ncbi:NADPH-dependent FMN reductase [Enterovirga sp. CN4-39]|uniref:NADPH-dependent FMN reductase n=1 Tax=Enterovirga sp. CN4-39 TaxID=3400910 RepID=UPI003C0BE769
MTARSWHHTRPMIVGLGGTTRPQSSSERAVRHVLAAAARRGADTEMFDGPMLAGLPMYAPEVPFRTPEALRLVEAMRRADAIVVASPGYHGSISGMLKNALDYTEDMREDGRPYFEERAVGCIVCAAGWQAVGTTLTAFRSIVHALRGWPTPLGVGINTAAGRVFDEAGACVDERVAAQLDTVAEQVLSFVGRDTVGRQAIAMAS